MKIIETIREFAFVVAVLLVLFVVAKLCIMLHNNAQRHIIDTDIPLDSVPTSKCYQRTIILKGSSDLGSNPMVNHQVPCDYKGNDNNWDDDLSKIK